MSKLNEVEHTADRAFRISGKDLRELFRNAAEVLFRVQGQRAIKSTSLIREVELNSLDRETLLVNWLNEILYLEESQNETFTRAEILEITDEHLQARLRGHKARKSRRIIKAVTFHDLQIRRTKRGLEAQIIVDV